ncbi:hypothetical protein NLJ89_g10839 [Agrocybe chaxingu]|uniref:HNH nuclease domain-containing protein n=1 Tax=Agrocybe chaxingu TaxID=84603 RepID=A0A9W8MS79_9AGAR|nr:hypothetical protein NLJ89_g10839 [Agrocybe chaxingu]
MEPPRSFCQECECTSCQGINRFESTCTRCDHCQRQDGGPYDPKTAQKPKPKRLKQLKQTSNARSTGDSIDSNQKESADEKFLKASSLLKLPKGTKACVITLQSEPGTGTEMCHIVARKKNTGPFRLSHFEFLWGIEYKEFCVDTSRNLMRLSANLHRAFNEDSWALLPIDDKVLSCMRVHYEERKILGPEMTQKQYERHIFKQVRIRITQQTAIDSFSTVYGLRKEKGIPICLASPVLPTNLELLPELL